MVYHGVKCAVMAAVTAGGLLSTASTGSAAARTVTAAPVADPPGCGSSVCFWSKERFHGFRWDWSEANGYRDMPPQLHDHVGSFVSNVHACFINWSPVEKRDVLAGDWRTFYLGDFGGRIDAVAPGPC